MPASVLIDRTTPDAAATSLPPRSFATGIGSAGGTDSPSLAAAAAAAAESTLPKPGADSFALQLANFGKATDFSTSTMGSGSSPLLSRCGPATLPNQGPSLAQMNRKSMNMTECVHVASSEHVAEIVGRQGSKIKALRAKTNTYIKTPVRGEEPVFVVTGRKEDVAAAKKEILSIAEHFSQIRAGRLNNNAGNLPPTSVGFLNADIPGHVTIHVRVPYRVVGLVVGPKGATIKRIQQDSQTYIVTPSRDREPIFEVTGLSENVEKARREIESYIALRTGVGLSDVGLNSSNNAVTRLRPFGPNCALDEVPGKDLNAQLLLGSMFKTPTCDSMTSSALASFNNTLNLTMTNKSHVLVENGTETSGGLFHGLLAANKKLDGLLPGYVGVSSGMPSEYALYSSSKAYDKLASPYCNGNLLASEIWSQMSNMEAPLLLDGLTALFPTAEEMAVLQDEVLMSDCNLRTLIANNNGDIEVGAKEKSLCSPLLVNGSAPGGYIANVRSGSVGSASNSPSVSPTDSVGSPG